MSEPGGIEALTSAAARLERIAEQLDDPQTPDAEAVALAREAAQLAADAGTAATEAARAAAESGAEGA